MPYATLSDLQARLSGDELEQLAPGAEPGELDEARIGLALADASDMVDGYLRSRYALPLSAVPSLLVGHACTIARFMLMERGAVTPTETAKAGYQAAVSFLRDVAAGKADLGLDGAGAEPAEDARSVIGWSGVRTATAEDLDDYRRGPLR